MLFRETVAVYCETHTEHTDTLCGEKLSLILKQVLFIVTSGLQTVKEVIQLSDMKNRSNNVYVNAEGCKI
jgi:hypothetical protein